MVEQNSERVFLYLSIYGHIKTGLKQSPSIVLTQAKVQIFTVTIFLPILPY